MTIYYSCRQISTYCREIYNYSVNRLNKFVHLKFELIILFELNLI